jgi:hypothetical protein
MLETAITLSEIFFCLQFAVKRKAVGIWGCKDCGKVKAGGAYTMKYFLAYSHYFFRNSPSTVTLGADLVYSYCQHCQCSHSQEHNPSPEGAD